jgi:hypothetical protein
MNKVNEKARLATVQRVRKISNAINPDRQLVSNNYANNNLSSNNLTGQTGVF